MNVASYLIAAAERAPSRIAVFYPTGKGLRAELSYGAVTFRDLDQESDRFAHGLRKMGIRRGCRTLLMVTPGVEFLALTFAIFKMGAVLVLIDPGMGKGNLLRCIEDVRPEALVAVSLVHALKGLYRRSFREIRHSVTVGRRWFWGGPSLAHVREKVWNRFPLEPVGAEEPAAILFTTGSTGIPKGVLYEHGMLDAQIQSIQSHFQITDRDVGLPAFVPFALFCVAMGTTCVLPRMDPTRPADVEPENILGPIERYGITYSFGSPAFWNRVSGYCVEQRLKLPTLKKIMLAGAPVPGEVLRRLQQILPGDGESYTPYGATEALPVTSVAGSEILAETLRLSQEGAGICVGRPLPGITLKIIRLSDEAIPVWDESLVLPAKEIGEIVVKGAVVTRDYYQRKDQNELAKISEGDYVWHRMGDAGYLDEKGRLWFCGRKNHRVTTAKETMFTVQCEAIFNQHPDVFRSALVGVGPRGEQRPVMVIEPKNGRMPAGAGPAKKLAQELLDLGSRSALTGGIREVLFHPKFPVDFRHNSKIIREKLALWAEGKTRGSAGLARPEVSTVRLDRTAQGSKAPSGGKPSQ